MDLKFILSYESSASAPDITEFHQPWDSKPMENPFRGLLLKLLQHGAALCFRIKSMQEKPFILFQIS